MFCKYTYLVIWIFKNRVGSKGLVPLLSSQTTVRAIRHTAVC